MGVETVQSDQALVGDQAEARLAQLDVIDLQAGEIDIGTQVECAQWRQRDQFFLGPAVRSIVFAFGCAGCGGRRAGRLLFGRQATLWMQIATA